MNLILLGGNSIDNKKWIEAVEICLKPLFQSTIIIDYDHWQTGEWMINLDKEKEKLALTAKNYDQYMIFAKSAGSLVAIKAIYEKLISPQKCVFAGIPLNWAKKSNFDIDTWYKDYSISTLAIQHTNDPLASSKELSDFLNQLTTTVKIEELPGDTHDYNELDTIKRLVSGFTK
ncbi:MAG: hypothetical protein ACOX6N_04500 [Patescibacteria group bacterium]|jgi:hypothetical protein